MMKRIIVQCFLAPLLIFWVMGFASYQSSVEKLPYKCMIQMKNYEGHGAYIVVSLIDPDGQYEETLYVLGDDDEWYFDITEWWKFYGKRRPDIDAIVGETIAGGERSVSVIHIGNDKVDKGYRLRFETAVEDQEYYVKDVEFDLTTNNLQNKVEGSGFIRYVRMMPK